MKKALAGLTLCLAFVAPANAWFFFFIPGSVTSAISDKLTGSEGDHCVSSAAKVGDTITIGGSTYLVKSLSGTSMRCTNSAHPIRAMLEPVATPVVAPVVAIPSPAVVPEWQPEKVFHLMRCVWPSAQANDAYNDSSAGYGTITRVTALYAPECNTERPHMATVRFYGNPPSENLPNVTTPAQPAQLAQPAQSAQSAQSKSIADRLRELKQLRDENLITAEQYESKQREILAAQ